MPEGTLARAFPCAAHRSSMEQYLFPLVNSHRFAYGCFDFPL
jgi:hypothetical protein